METRVMLPTFKIKGFLKHSDLLNIIEAQDTIHTYWVHRNSKVLDFRSSVQRILRANIGILRTLKSSAKLREEINVIKDTLGEEVSNEFIFVDVK